MHLISKEGINLTLYCFLRPRQRRTLLLTALALGFWVVLRNPCFITSDESIKQICFCLMTLDVNTVHLYAVGARSVMVIVVGNGLGDTSSNPGRD